MDIRNTLDKEHTKVNTIKITKYIGANTARFNELIQIFLAGPYRITQRAAWVISYSVQNEPALLYPHLPVVLHFCTGDVHDAAKRNILRILSRIEIPPQHNETVIDLCFKLLEDKKEPVAVRAFSIAILGELTKPYPELQNELAMLIGDQLPYSSPGFVSRGNKFLKSIGRK